MHPVWFHFPWPFFKVGVAMWFSLQKGCGGKSKKCHVLFISSKALSRTSPIPFPTAWNMDLEMRPHSFNHADQDIARGRGWHNYRIERAWVPVPKDPGEGLPLQVWTSHTSHCNRKDRISFNFIWASVFWSLSATTAYTVPSYHTEWVWE